MSVDNLFLSSMLIIAWSDAILAAAIRLAQVSLWAFPTIGNFGKFDKFGNLGLMVFDILEIWITWAKWYQCNFLKYQTFSEHFCTISKDECQHIMLFHEALPSNTTWFNEASNRTSFLEKYATQNYPITTFLKATLSNA